MLWSVPELLPLPGPMHNIVGHASHMVYAVPPLPGSHTQRQQLYQVNNVDFCGEKKVNKRKIKPIFAKC